MPVDRIHHSTLLTSLARMRTLLPGPPIRPRPASVLIPSYREPRHSRTTTQGESCSDSHGDEALDDLYSGIHVASMVVLDVVCVRFGTDGPVLSVHADASNARREMMRIMCTLLGLADAEFSNILRAANLMVQARVFYMCLSCGAINDGCSMMLGDDAPAPATKLGAYDESSAKIGKVQTKGKPSRSSRNSISGGAGDLAGPGVERRIPSNESLMLMTDDKPGNVGPNVPRLGDAVSFPVRSRPPVHGIK